MRDPLVGRHLLIGCLLGAGIGVLWTLYQLLPLLLDQNPGLFWGSTNQLDTPHSGRRAFAQALVHECGSIRPGPAVARSSLDNGR